MKRVFTLLLAAAMCFSLGACAGSGEPEKYKKYETLIDCMEAKDYDGALAEITRISEEDKDADTPEVSQQKTTEIELTLDNWQEYFEIKQYLGSYIGKNDFDEPTEYRYFLYTFFAIKEEWAENVVSCDGAIEYDADSSPKNVSFNAKDMTFEITGDYEGDDCPSYYYDSSTYKRGGTGKLFAQSFNQYTLKDGRIEQREIHMPYSAPIRGNVNEQNYVRIHTDNDSEWKETNEGFVDAYTENVKITRIQGKLVLNQ